MSVIVKSGGESNYTPHPEGQYNAICIDVVDVGWTRGSALYPDPKYKIDLVFFCGLLTEPKEFDGETKVYPMTVRARFTASLHEKANLRKFARGWRGADFSDDEVRGGFDFEKMLSAPAFLQIEHNVASNGNTYANIVVAMRLPHGQAAPQLPTDYTRVCEREGWTGPARHPDDMMTDPEPAPAEPASHNEPDDDLPF